MFHLDKMCLPQLVSVSGFVVLEFWCDGGGGDLAHQSGDKKMLVIVLEVEKEKEDKDEEETLAISIHSNALLSVLVLVLALIVIA